MIRIDRPPTAPEYLSRDSVKKETARALALFSPDKLRSTTTDAAKIAVLKERDAFQFTKYRNQKVKKALEEMCLLKCAFCESTFKHVYYGDIEHFRPKKMVTDLMADLSQKPGYYWLSNDWNNLLLSCLFCNQASKQFVQQIGGGKKELTIGKRNEFPLSNKSLFKNTRSYDEWITDEVKRKEDKARKILDPCKDEPEEHFAYTVEGIIIPKKINGVVSSRAETSIRVYGLQRHFLVQERKKLLLLLEARKLSVMNAWVDMHEAKDDSTVRLDFYTRRFKKELRELIQFTRSEMPFAGMCRFFVTKFLIEVLDYPKERKENLSTYFRDSKGLERIDREMSYPGGI